MNKKQRKGTVGLRGQFFIDDAGNRITIHESIEDDPYFDPNGTATAAARANSNYRSREQWATLANHAAGTMHAIEFSSGTTDLQGRNTGTHLRSYKQAMAICVLCRTMAAPDSTSVVAAVPARGAFFRIDITREHAAVAHSAVHPKMS
jgi:hypothetical protein